MVVTLSQWARQKLLFSTLYGKRISPMTYVDIGARGDIEEPWCLMADNAIRVVGFEPDSEECSRLNDSFSNRLYIPSAVWSKPAELTLHINRVPSTSSVFPANMSAIRHFAPDHVEPRMTDHTARVTAQTLDTALSASGIDADIVKIDTQGAEFEILLGAEQTLRRHAVAVIVETWTIEAYQGQKLTGDILSLMATQGFHLYDIGIAAAWGRASAAELGGLTRQQITGLDLLFLKDDAAALGAAGPEKIFKAAGIADLYGHSDAALDLLRAAATGPLADFAQQAEGYIRDHYARRRGIVERIRRKLARLTRNTARDEPALSY